MELNWSTFILEVVNFLVLVWILKRFLYRPVLDVIARRRADIEKTLKDADARLSEAQSLQNRYESRIADWEAEREDARADLSREIDEERRKQLQALQTSLAQEQEKSAIIEARRASDSLRQIEHSALKQGAQFAARLLEQSATSELQSRLLEMLIDRVSVLPSERLLGQGLSIDQAMDPIEVTSAFALSEQQRADLQQALSKATNTKTAIRFTEDPQLLAGLRITVGAYVLGLNLQDELEGFARLAHDKD